MARFGGRCQLCDRCRIGRNAVVVVRVAVTTDNGGGLDRTHAQIVRILLVRQTLLLLAQRRNGYHRVKSVTFIVIVVMPKVILTTMRWRGVVRG